MQNKRTWAFDPTHTKIGFSVTHFMITEVEGFFDQYQGTVTAGTDDFSDVSVDLTIPLTGIDTREKSRDAHLRTADFFKADQHPDIVFKSTGMSSKGGRHYTMPGDLSMAGVTRPVELDVEFKGIVPKDPYGKTKAGFKVTGRIDRKDWGITWNTTLDMGGLAVSNEVDIIAHVQLDLQP